MKILSFTAICATAILSLASCSKQTDVKVSDSSTGGNNNTGGGFTVNWTGTAPMSAKINGRDFLAISASASTANGITGASGLNEQPSGISIVFPADAAVGSTHIVPGPKAIISYSKMPEMVTFLPVGGKIKITKNDAVTVEGYFFGDLKNSAAVGSADTPVHITEGYFKINKQ